MTPLLRQLDRASQVRPWSASASVACPPAGGSAPQVDPAPHDNGTPLSGSASFGCVCGHSRHAHRGYGPCLEPGCTCWTVRKPSTQEEAPALSPQPGA